MLGSRENGLEAFVLMGCRFHQQILQKASMTQQIIHSLTQNADDTGKLQACNTDFPFPKRLLHYESGTHALKCFGCLQLIWFPTFVACVVGLAFIRPGRWPLIVHAQKVMT